MQGPRRPTRRLRGRGIRTAHRRPSSAATRRGRSSRGPRGSPRAKRAGVLSGGRPHGLRQARPLSSVLPRRIDAQVAEGHIVGHTHGELVDRLVLRLAVGAVEYNAHVRQCALVRSAALAERRVRACGHRLVERSEHHVIDRLLETGLVQCNPLDILGFPAPRLHDQVEGPSVGELPREHTQPATHLLDHALAVGECRGRGDDRLLRKWQDATRSAHSPGG
eukprot:scaffold17736_cov62-Phaeocystis_antarctica.AAC.2